MVKYNSILLRYLTLVLRNYYKVQNVKYTDASIKPSRKKKLNKIKTKPSDEEKKKLSKELTIHTPYILHPLNSKIQNSNPQKSKLSNSKRTTTLAKKNKFGML